VEHPEADWLFLAAREKFQSGPFNIVISNAVPVGYFDAKNIKMRLLFAQLDCIPTSMATVLWLVST